MDSEYWKKLYKGKWPDGERRARAIVALIEKWGFSVLPFGFMVGSVEYAKESPKEKGIPDFKIMIKEKNIALLEATGTEHSRGDDEIWLRNDKFEYAERHREIECWAGHIIEDRNLIRFVKLEEKDRFRLEHREIRGVEETFRIVPENDKSILSSTEFEKYLETKKET